MVRLKKFFCGDCGWCDISGDFGGWDGDRIVRDGCERTR